MGATPFDQFLPSAVQQLIEEGCVHYSLASVCTRTYMWFIFTEHKWYSFHYLFVVAIGFLKLLLWKINGILFFVIIVDFLFMFDHLSYSKY
jgi:hypothetical protein